VEAVEVNGYTIEPGAHHTGADLTGADLNQANLEGASLRGANLEGANLEGATANEDTSWPQGFDPVAAGVIID